MPDPVFFPAWISNHAGRRSALCWGPPCATLTVARHLAAAEVNAGNATLGFVVRAEGGVRTAVASAVYPQSAARIVRHWLELLEAIEDA